MIRERAQNEIEVPEHFVVGLPADEILHLLTEVVGIDERNLSAIGGITVVERPGRICEAMLSDYMAEVQPKKKAAAE